MSSETDLYLMQPQGDDGEDWISPTPVRTAVVEALAEATDVTDDDVDELDTYVALEDLQTVVDDTDDQLSFEVEGHEVTVHSDGEVGVAA